MRRGLAEAGQGPMLFAALASYVAQCACRGSVPSSLLNRTMVEAGKLGAAGEAAGRCKRCDGWPCVTMRRGPMPLRRTIIIPLPCHLQLRCRPS